MLLCLPCLALDALGAVVFTNYYRGENAAAQAFLEEAFAGIRIDPSDAFFHLLVDRVGLDAVLDMDVDGLADAFLPLLGEDAYVSRFADAVRAGFAALRARDFVGLWRTHLLPGLQAQCDAYVAAVDPARVEALLADVRRFKPDAAARGVRVVMSHFAYPVNFLLDESSYLASYGPVADVQPLYALRLLAHELCHRFSTEASRAAYRRACAADPFLGRANVHLVDVIGAPGDEEAFVVGLEHVIALRNGLETLEEARDSLFRRYHSSLPVSVLLFEALRGPDALPADINGWLVAWLDGLAAAGDAEAAVERVLPGYAARFAGYAGQ